MTIEDNFKKNFYREYSFSEWNDLSNSEKLKLQNSYWYDDKGKLTRAAILDEFIKHYPEIVLKSVEIGFCYFGWEVSCLYVLTSKLFLKIPNKFAGVPVNRGLKINKLIYWWYTGLSNTRQLLASNDLRQIAFSKLRERNI